MKNNLLAKFEKNQQKIAEVNKKIEAEVGHLISQRDKLEAANAEMREQIKQAMEENDIKKFDGDLVAITYVAPTTRTSFDSKRFAEERPGIYKKYLKTSEVKSSIRIKVKA
jgi:hypothetical protein plarl_06420